MQSKQPILEVCLLRLVLIVLLVLDHSFAPFSGFWPMPEGVETSSEPYWWFGRLSFSFMLECFTFVSGWVLGTQVLTKGSQVLNFKRLILSKVKRLLVPCAVFGVVYILLATPQAFANPLHALNVLANGVGHLWYLPMLFWCFVALWLIERAKLNKNQVLIALLLLAVFSVFPFQLRLGKTMYYMFFFYVGYLVGIKHFQLPHFPSWRTVATLGCAFAVTFVLGNQLVVKNCKLLEIIQMGGGNLLKDTILNLTRLLWSSLGVMFVTLLSTSLLSSTRITLNKFWINLSTYTFGIYIFQQFILQALYFHSPFPTAVGYAAMPWLAFLITLPLSLLCAVVMRKTPILKQMKL